MILEFDVGNSRIKWRQVDERQGSVMREGHVSAVNQLIAMHDSHCEPTMVRMCSVRAGDVNDRIRQWTGDTWGLEIQVAKVVRSCGGVSNQYADLNKLGVDRWLEMLAAYARATDFCVIVDAGTAVTVDVVDDRGSHLGGYILPGLKLMSLSLQTNTQIKLSDETPEYFLALGHSTDAAVRNGTLMALTSLIERVVQPISAQSAQARLFFCGGDAELLANNTNVADIEVIPGLVLDGLAIACPYLPEDLE